MANYLIVCVGEDNNAMVEKWFSFSDELNTDLLQIKLNDNKCIYYLSNCGKFDSTADGGVFKGYAIDHKFKQIIYSGGNIAPDVNLPIPGCYIRVQRDSDKFVVGNDLFGQLPIIYSFEKDIIAISDSIFILTEIRRHFAIKNKANIDAALSRSWIHGMANQPLGTSTLIDGIYSCPPGSKIHINYAGNKPIPNIEKGLAHDLFPGNVADYEETILDGARKIASVVATVAQIPNVKTGITLSGGVDSRICLAGALSHSTRDSFYFHTNKANADDFTVAKNLAERFNLEFKSGKKSKEQIPTWFLSCAGLYDPLISVEEPTQDYIDVKIHGFGAEIYKGYYNWRPLSLITPAKVGYVSAIRRSMELHKASFVKPTQTYISKLGSLIGLPGPKASIDISKAAHREASKGLYAVGIESDNNWSAEWHYLYYNNSIHSGRTTVRSLLDINPLMQHDLVCLSRSRTNYYPRPKEGAPSMVTDLLISLNPELATIPFDDARKNLSYDYIEERSRFLGRVSSVDPYSVVGDPRFVNSGTPKMFSKIIKSRGFYGNFSPDAVKQLVKDGYELIPSDIKYAYSIPKVLVEKEMKNISRSSWYCRGAAKIMSFLLTN